MPYSMVIIFTDIFIWYRALPACITVVYSGKKNSRLTEMFWNFRAIDFSVFVVRGENSRVGKWRLVARKKKW